MLLVATLAAAAEPDLRVEVHIPGDAPRVEVDIRGPDGAVVWSCRSDAPVSCPDAAGWYAGAGAYTVEARIPRGRRTLKRADRVEVGGEELAIEVIVEAGHAWDAATGTSKEALELRPLVSTRLL